VGPNLAVLRPTLLGYRHLILRSLAECSQSMGSLSASVMRRALFQRP